MKTILIVEDDREMRNALGLLLKSAGYNVKSFEKAQAGFDEYDEIKPDLVIMDIILPEINGIDCIRNLIEKDSSAKVIAYSGMHHKELAKEAIDAGAMDFIIKPFENEEILSKITEHIEN